MTTNKTVATVENIKSIKDFDKLTFTQHMPWVELKEYLGIQIVLNLENAVNKHKRDEARRYEICEDLGTEFVPNDFLSMVSDYDNPKHYWRVSMPVSLAEKFLKGEEIKFEAQVSNEILLGKPLTAQDKRSGKTPAKPCRLIRFKEGFNPKTMI